MLWNGLGIALMSGGGTSYSFVNAEASAYVAAMSVQPDDTRKELIDTYVGALKSSGVWPALDILYVLASHDSQAAKLNLKAPASFVAVNVGAGPTFVADRGFTSNGSSTALDTQWVPNTNGVNFTLNDASQWVWCLTNAQSNQRAIGGNSGSPAGFICPRSTTDAVIAQMNSGSAQTLGAGSFTTSVGFTGYQRRAAGAMAVFKDGVSAATATAAASSRATQSQWICGGNNNSFDPRQIAIAAWGASLNTLEAGFYNATLAYLQGVGAAP